MMAKRNDRTELDLQIDQDRLDDEWLEQPRRYYDYAARLASARRDLEMTKAELDLTKAELDRDIRTNPEAFGVGKLTEKSVESAVPRQDRYKVALVNVVEARHSVDVLQAAVSALDHRRKALENLVSLFLANYFSRPQPRDGSRERMDEVEKRGVRTRGRDRRVSRD